MTRATSALPEPPALEVLAALVAQRGAVVPAGTALFRAHRAAYGPWWAFSASATPRGGGRFDLPAPRGTCYLADQADVALREGLGARLIGARLLGAKEAAAAAVSVTVLHTDLPVADTTDPAAAGIWTREINTSIDYPLTRRWAAAFDEAGAQGLVYESRFTTDAGAHALARFAPAGDQAWPTTGTMSVEELLATTGVAVEAEVPGDRAEVIPPPL